MSASPLNSRFTPSCSLAALARRGELLAQIRGFFARQGFLEVETPLLSGETVVDLHLDPLAVTLFDSPQQPEVGRRMWLQTSPEFAMKRLLAAGLPAIYQITRSFRGGEQGPRHNPEFTILEWYRAGDSYEQGMDLLAELATALLGPASPPVRLTYQAAFQNALGIDPLSCSTSKLETVARDQGLAPSTGDWERDDWLNLLLSERVEPTFVPLGPVILCDYPASQAALARLSPDDPRVAERFELYAGGFELANGYHELLDPSVLRERTRSNNQRRVHQGKPALPEESHLLAAMEAGLPACSGVALGVDRLLMVLTGAERLEQVLPFPIERA